MRRSEIALVHDGSLSGLWPPLGCSQNFVFAQGGGLSLCVLFWCDFRRFLFPGISLQKTGHSVQVDCASSLLMISKGRSSFLCNESTGFLVLS